MQSNVERSETGGRVSYSRAEILALYDFGKSIPLQDDVIKKSQTGTRASRSKPKEKRLVIHSQAMETPKKLMVVVARI
ncbi:unnamed protein product [Schistosoma mattheei]|uniref:Uncharacterized protein n=1 Tax=Schistosoma mattheei TaxID=31246 RepID=A0AA85BLQ6_9TREM|nr:unnamed protein product [Schistosoma mattheei]